jgi:DNA mismatch repair protein MutS
MMQQYSRIKQDHRDTILFFRLGDFYEMFRSDAEEASRLLGLTLTSRQGVPMCGVPHHAAHGYIGRLLKQGKKVAICEQTKLPQGGKGLAEREVIEVITPGTATEEDFLEARANNYLVAIGSVSGDICLAYADLSTGELGLTSRAVGVGPAFVRGELARLHPREVLIQQSLLDSQEMSAVLTERDALLINRFPDWQFDLRESHQKLERLFGVANLKAFGIDPESKLPLAAGTLVGYLEETARSVLPHIRSITIDRDDSYLGLDESTVRNLELVANMHDGSRRFSLLEVVDETRTAMGARTLRRWLLSPLRDLAAIQARQNQVMILYRNQSTLANVREQLGRVLDLERLSARVGMQRAHAKDLVAIRDSMRHAAEIWKILEAGGAGELSFCLQFNQAEREKIGAIESILRHALLDEPSTLFTEGRLIRSGYNEELDHLHELRDNSRSVLDNYLAEEREATGISGLRVKYNRVIGHFIEVNRANAERLPDHFIRRQSLANAERFTTERLGEIESAINDAAERIVETERGLFLQIRADVAAKLNVMMNLAGALSELDVLQGLAYVATVRGYVCPELTVEPGLRITGGRHPVVEDNLPSGSFVPNGTNLDPNGSYFGLITGPNMAGKSTYLRQVAQIVLLSQIGSFVPADDAVVGLADRIFCRVGASDNLARGESTFLVEMNEAAYILRNATSRSLVIMDEIGRGTSTNDGLAIAQAVTEDLVNRIRCRTLFATHFHELTALTLPEIANSSLKVVDDGGSIVFLKRLEPGPSSNSYGIHVAEVAGLPKEVVARGAEILSELVRAKESPTLDADAGELPREAEDAAQDSDRKPPEPDLEQGLFPAEELVTQEIRSINTDELRPLDALRNIDRWKRELDKS